MQPRGRDVQEITLPIETYGSAIVVIHSTERQLHIKISSDYTRISGISKDSEV